MLLAALYTEAQRWDELGPVLAELPPRPTLLARRAAIAEAAGRNEEALSLWEQAAAAGLSLTTPALSRLYARLGRWESLAELLEKVQANGASSKVALNARYRAAEVRLERLAQPARAVELLAAAVAAEPDALPLLLAHERALDDDPGAARRAQGAGGEDARSGAARGAAWRRWRRRRARARWWRRGSTRWRCRRAIRSSP